MFLIIYRVDDCSRRVSHVRARKTGRGAEWLARRGTSGCSGAR